MSNMEDEMDWTTTPKTGGNSSEDRTSPPTEMTSNSSLPSGAYQNILPTSSSTEIVESTALPFTDDDTAIPVQP
jgi:hypothetical protein